MASEGKGSCHDCLDYETPSKQYENGLFTYFEVITGLPRPYYITLPQTDEPHMQKEGKFGEVPVTLTRTRVEDAALQNQLPDLETARL